MKTILLTSSLIGATLFSLLFAVTYLSPEIIDKSARQFVIAQIEKKVTKKISEIGNKITNGESENKYKQKLKQKFSHLKDKYQDEIALIKEELKDGIEKRITEIYDKMCKLDCLKQKGISISKSTIIQIAKDGLKNEISSLTSATDNLAELVKGKYYRIILELLQDLRIFSGINVVLFLFIASLLNLTSKASVVILPASLLLVSTIISILFYIFGQNWFYTLIFSNYMGWGYLTYVGIIFGFLLDITFNDGEITLGILEKVSNWLKSILECCKVG